jgi:hypothetical protein
VAAILLIPKNVSTVFFQPKPLNLKTIFADRVSGIFNE